MLNILDKLDKKILSLPAHRLHEVLPGPTLVHLKGNREPALYLSVLLHGNENTGWEVVKNILKKYQDKNLPRSLSIFIGNVKAARYKKRKLEKQIDFNRVWGIGDSEEHQMANTITEIMRERGVFASIDIHNNNGLNPHYACINRLDKTYLKLAREFSRMVIYFIRPYGVQSLAFAEFCPAVTLECGQPGDEYGIQMTTRYVDNILNLESLPIEDSLEQTIDLYHTVGVVKIPDELDFSFDGKIADIEFISGIENLNFEEIIKGTLIAKIKPGIERPLIALDEDGNDIFDDYFIIENDNIFTRSTTMPAMLTTAINIIKQDCLCYLMEDYDISRGEKHLKEEAPLWK